MTTATAQQPPFVVLAGARGLGKSTALRELRETYRGRTPVALIDGEEPRFAQPPPGRPPASWSPVYEALSAIAEQLGEPVGGAGRITFPRLACGLLAVAAGGWRDRGLPRIRAEAERILLLSDTGGRLTGRWAGRVVARLVSSMSEQGPVAEAIIEAALEAFSEGMSSSYRRLRRGAVWYRDHPNAAGNPKLGLVLLSRRFRAGGDARTHAEHHLVRALLTDLDDAYARAGRPVILLDNVQEAAGRRLMESVLRERADGRADHVAFFAGLRGQGHPALRHAARRTLPEEITRTSGWDWTPGATPSSRALLISLPPLSPEDTLRIIETACTGMPIPPRLPYATHRLTGGSPLGTALIAESARQNLPRGVTTLTELLSATMVVPDEDHAGHPTYRVLLDRLLPHESHLNELAVLAAAHDRDSALALSEAHLPDDFDESAVRALEERLAREGHAPTPGHFVNDPFLRTLLLLCPHRRDRRAVHRTLADHYGPTRAAHRAHHELAFGNADFAVAHLSATFHEADPRTWLESLAFIASAPHADSPDGPDDRGRPDLTLHPRDPRVRRLLHAVWQLTDPLVPPDPEAAERVRQELEQLSATRQSPDALLWRASRDWPDDAIAGRPLRVG